MTDGLHLQIERPALSIPGIRFFEHFPKQTLCFLCGTNDDLPCILVGVDGTTDGGIEQAEPIHARCLVDRNRVRINRDVGVLYAMKHSIDNPQEARHD